MLWGFWESGPRRQQYPYLFHTDGLRFPDFIHTQKRDPRTNYKHPQAQWDSGKASIKGRSYSLTAAAVATCGKCGVGLCMQHLAEAQAHDVGGMKYSCPHVPLPASRERRS